MCDVRRASTLHIKRTIPICSAFCLTELHFSSPGKILRCLGLRSNNTKHRRTNYGVWRYIVFCARSSLHAPSTFIFCDASENFSQKNEMRSHEAQRGISLIERIVVVCFCCVSYMPDIAAHRYCCQSQRTCAWNDMILTKPNPETFFAARETKGTNARTDEKLQWKFMHIAHAQAPPFFLT